MTLKKNITNLSDNSPWNFNTNIAPANQSILARILALNPVSYNWNTENDTATAHDGFIAQEVRQVFPSLVATDPKTGLLSLNYTGLIPYTVQAIKEMNFNITSLNDTSRSNSWRDAIAGWFASTANGIGDFVADRLRARQEVCINETCINESQLKQLLQQDGSVSAPLTTTVTGNTQSPEVIPEVPVVETQTPAVSDPAINNQ